MLAIPIGAGIIYAFAQPKVNETIEKVVPLPPAAEQQPQGLAALKDFFKEQIRQFDFIRLQDGYIHSFNISQKNKISFDGGHIASANDIRSILTNKLRTAHTNYRNKTGKDQIQCIGVTYTSDIEDNILCLYLNEIKAAFEDLRKEHTAQSGENEEDPFPTIVFFNEPNTYTRERHTKRYEGFEITLTNGERKVLRDFTENELAQAVGNMDFSNEDEYVTVGLKAYKNKKMEDVIEVRQLLKKLYEPQQIILRQSILTN